MAPPKLNAKNSMCEIMNVLSWRDATLPVVDKLFRISITPSFLQRNKRNLQFCRRVSFLADPSIAFDT